MQITRLVSIITLGLAAVSSALVIDSDHDSVNHQNNDADVDFPQETFSLRARAAPVCKKKAVAKPIPKRKAVVPPKTGPRSLDKRAPQHFALNGPPKMGLLNEPTPLWTSDLMGCTVVIIASTTHVFGVHCSRGRGTVTPFHVQTGTMPPDYQTPEAVATAAIRDLLALYTPNKVAAGKGVQAMVITATQPWGDDVATQMQTDLVAGGITTVKWYTYDAMAISRLTGAAKTAAGQLTVKAAGAGKLPVVQLGDVCYNF
jgi:hypothetical protein